MCIRDSYNALKNPQDETPVSYGLNSRLVKEDGKIQEKVWKVGGLYGPVSYTHLDVYKRQRLGLATLEQKEGKYEAALSILNAMIAEKGGEATRLTTQPVSYTHLATARSLSS